MQRNAREFRLVANIDRLSEAEAEIGGRREVNFRFGKNGDGAVDHQAHIGIRVVGGQVNQAAGDAALRSVGGANAVNDSVGNRLAGIVDLCYFCSNGERSAAGGHDVIKDQFQSGRIVFEPQANSPNRNDVPVHFEPCRECWA